MTEEEIFHHALALSQPEERAAYLQQACARNAALQAGVEALLRAHVGASGFMDHPAPVLIATVDEQPIRERAGTVIGPYKLLEQIGEGGFGVVYMAEQTQPVRRKVALKILKPGMDTRQVVARFEAERQALALMDHPNIAKVFDGGETTAGRPYFVMELVKGVPITDFGDHNQLTLRQRLALFVPVCQAVQHAHQKGIIHRDLKPSNVLVSRHDTTPVVKVIDFGVAKALGQELTDKTLFTSIAQMIGTPLYMSPEQAGMSDLDVDTRSDIYSLGVLLYELLTGTTPFDKERLRAAGYEEIRRIIREEEAPRPSTRISTLGQAAATVAANRQSEPRRLGQLMRGELDWIVMKALEKDRNRRYDAANAFAQDVQRYLADEPVLACPPSTWYRFRKFARRNKRSLTTATILAIGALVMTVVVGGALVRIARDRSVRQARLNIEVEHALDEASRARDRALTLTDNPDRWQAALAEALSGLKRAKGLASQEEAALQLPTRERLRELEAVLNADENDRRFAARFEEIRVEQAQVNNLGISGFKYGIAFAPLKLAFEHYYGLEFGTTPVGQTVDVIKRRPPVVRDLLLAALEVSVDDSNKEDPQVREWLVEAVKGADTGPCRKRAYEALAAGDLKAFEQAVTEALQARQPPSHLVGLVVRSQVNSPICVGLLRRICRAYPGDFWANYYLANYLQYTATPHLQEAIRYYGAALALRPGNPVALVHLANALRAAGDVDGAISIYHEVLERHPDYGEAHQRLSLAFQQKGLLEEAVLEIQEAIRVRRYYSEDYYILGSLLAATGHPDTAASSFDRSLELQPGNHEAWHRVAALEAAAGDADAYRRRCRAMLNRFGDVRQPVIAERTVKACLLLPDALSPADFDRVQSLAERAITGTEKQPYYRFFVMAKGLADYRAGRWAEAVKWLERFPPNPNGIHWDATKFAVLAMAHHRLGQADAAQTALKNARSIVLQKMPDPVHGRPFGGGDWHDWLHAKIFLREAEEMVKKESGAKSQESGKKPN